MQRTSQQRKGMEVYFKLVADALEDGGLSMQTVLRHYRMDVPWTQESVKSVIWKLAQERMFKKKSTTELSTDEVTKVYEVVNRFLTQELKMESIPFPKIKEYICQRCNYHETRCKCLPERTPLT